MAGGGVGGGGAAAAAAVALGHIVAPFGLCRAIKLNLTLPVVQTVARRYQFQLVVGVALAISSYSG